MNGRIYQDIWPLNLAGLYCADLTGLWKAQLDMLYPDGWEANTHMLLLTLTIPYLGQWHVDAPPYADDTILLACLAGKDELEWGEGYHDALLPGQVLLMPAWTRHRGRCSTFRVTYHCRVGPKGRTMPESPPDRLPPMTVKRFIRRTLSTLSYYLLRLPEDHWLCEKYKWMVPRVK
jgi:hypothetical protein